MVVGFGDVGARHRPYHASGAGFPPVRVSRTASCGTSRAGHLVREVPGDAAAGGAPRGIGARTIASRLANIKSTDEDVFPAQKSPRVLRTCRRVNGNADHRWA